MNAAEAFLTWGWKSNIFVDVDILEEIKIACVFANPFMTRLEEPLSFSDPSDFRNGRYQAKPLVFGKIIQSYVGEKITLREFGRLMGKFSETCTRNEWRDFYKPVLEQRLLYRGQSADPFFHRNLVFPKLDGPPEISGRIPYVIMGGLRPSLSHQMVRVGKGKLSFYTPRGFPLHPPSERLPKFIESLILEPVEYFLEVFMGGSQLVTDIVPWEMYWNEASYPPYMVRREVLELVVPPEEEYLIGEMFEDCMLEEIEAAIAERGNVCAIRKHDGRYCGVEAIRDVVVTGG